MAQWNIEKLEEAGIRDILIVSGQEQCGSIIQQFGDGSSLGCSITYKVQSNAGGIAQALRLAKDFTRDEPMCVILGDNIFDMKLSEIPMMFTKGAMVFLKKVPDPSRYGVAIFSAHNGLLERQVLIDSIEEKPKNPKSDYAVTGIYCYDSQVYDIIDSIKPSARGELEITDVNNEYVRRGQMTAFIMKDEDFWSDAGTFTSYAYVNDYVNSKRDNI